MARSRRRDTMASFPREIRAKNGQEFVVDFAEADQAQEVYDFLVPHFFLAKPIRYLEPCDPLDAGIQKRRMAAVRSLFAGRLSLAVRDPAGQLVAVALNSVERRGDDGHDEVPPSGDNDPWRMVSALHSEMKGELDLFDKYQTDKVLHLFIMAVSSQYVRLGLATTLVELSLELAKANGVGAVYTEATNYHTVTITSKHGFESLRTVDYATFEFEGAKPFAGNDEMLAEFPIASFMARRA